MFWGNEQTTFFEAILFQQLGQPVEVIDTQFLSGGDISTAARVGTSAGTFFVKWNQANLSGVGQNRLNEPMPAGDELFAVEAAGLNLLRQTRTVRVPAVVGNGRQGDQAYLVLEYIEPAMSSLVGAPATYWTQLGQQLAQLHRHTQPQFGLDDDNFIGTLLQRNALTDNGYVFFFDHRLLPQAGQALYSGLLPKASYDALLRLGNALPGLLPDERPALLHGDLWTGNVLRTAADDPAVIDPAVYYGYREAELAFTRLFGGFSGTFYEAYAEAFPLESGFANRVPIYNLYPLLVHVNLFGSGYVSGVERVLRRF